MASKKRSVKEVTGMLVSATRAKDGIVPPKEGAKMRPSEKKPVYPETSAPAVDALHPPVDVDDESSTLMQVDAERFIRPGAVDVVVQYRYDPDKCLLMLSSGKHVEVQASAAATIKALGL